MLLKYSRYIFPPPRNILNFEKKILTPFKVFHSRGLVPFGAPPPYIPFAGLHFKNK